MTDAKQAREEWQRMTPAERNKIIRARVRAYARVLEGETAMDRDRNSYLPPERLIHTHITVEGELRARIKELEAMVVLFAYCEDSETRAKLREELNVPPRFGET